jgi:hypothetical protein
VFCCSVTSEEYIKMLKRGLALTGTYKSIFKKDQKGGANFDNRACMLIAILRRKRLILKLFLFKGHS